MTIGFISGRKNGTVVERPTAASRPAATTTSR